MRCTACLTNWPPKPEFETCPECDELTRPSWQEAPIPADEATRRLNHALFEKYLEAEGRQ